MRRWMRWSLFTSVGAALLLATGALAQREAMSFFVTSAGPGKGADLGGVAGADRHCQSLAAVAGAGRRTWRALTEKGDMVKGRGDAPNMHDILTGSQADGRAFTGDKDMTCGNWTKSGDGAAMVGHHDRIGLGDDDASKSWNASHLSSGCSQEALRGTGGDGLYYCFAVN